MFYSQLILASKIDNIIEIEKFIDEIILKLHIEEDYLGVLSTPLIEAFKNAVEYGNKNDVNKKVTIAVQIENQQLSFSVADQGKGFNYDYLMNLPLEERINNGLTKIKVLSNRVNFSNNGATITYSLQIPFSLNTIDRHSIMAKNNALASRRKKIAVDDLT